MIYNSFCQSMNCVHFIKWGFTSPPDDPEDKGIWYDCYSCSLIGQSYNVDLMPDYCPYKEKLSEWEKEVEK